MKDIRQGMFARSLAGHDAGTLYVVLRAEQDTVYLTDGKYRKVSSPKKKNRKHIQIDFQTDPLIDSRISAGEIIRDSDVRKAIRSKEMNNDIRTADEI